MPNFRRFLKKLIMATRPLLQDKVELKPKNYLIMVGKMNVEREVTFTIKNKTGFEIAFKMKHTSPTFVRITPSYGYLSSNETKTIKVIAKKSDCPIPQHPQRVTVVLSYVDTSKPAEPEKFWRGAVNSQTDCKICLPFVFSEIPVKDVSKIIDLSESSDAKNEDDD